MLDSADADEQEGGTSLLSAQRWRQRSARRETRTPLAAPGNL